MLNQWLENQSRDPNPYKHFSVIDILEKEEVTSQVKTYLAELLQAESCDLNFFRSMAEVLGWDRAQQMLVADLIPTLDRVKRGDFGEALSNAIVEQFYGYSIPVRKLRFKLVGNQTLPATDSLAIKMNSEGVIIEVCYIESKLRTTADNGVAVEAYDQLQRDYNSLLPPILKFIAARLYDSDSPLFDSFSQYMRDRGDNRDKDTFILGLCFDHSCWSENVLEALDENPLELPKLSTHAMRIKNLRKLADETFKELGITEVFEDE